MIPTNNRGSGVSDVYSNLDRKYEEEETQRKAKESNIAYMNLYGFPVDARILDLLPRELAESYEAVVFYKEGKRVKLGLTAMGDFEKPAIKHLTDQGLIIEKFLISQSSFKHFFAHYNLLKQVSHGEAVISLNTSDTRFNLESLKNLGEKIAEISATEAIEYLLGTAFKINASDIHLEPEKTELKIRLRIDGVLQDVATVNIKAHHPLVSRIKILSKLKLNITTTPQDGSFSLNLDNSPADIRVSVLPSTFGESIVMRLLRQDQGALKFDELGIMGLAREQILKEMQKPNGMILTTGPTGSGKTTTLYAILNKLNEPGVKIITLEDPVEYKIEGITQTPIDSRAGMTFASALRAVLRQDPDIVMIGEMRDLETAETASQAALTGHIVLSTLHTNDAPGALPRLIDLGVKPFVLAPAINAIIAQRLVRKICPDCKQEYKLQDNLQSRVEMILKAIPKNSKAEVPKQMKFYHSIGCDKCHGLGYRGRLGVYEVFTINDEIEKLIIKGGTTSEIKKQAIQDGMLTMAQDGILKALQGITDIEEVFRVTEE
jgi:type II secretory ATPase GspE/PulE/Tfp pilus assembly ATPase PilB-like protein